MKRFLATTLSLLALTLSMHAAEHRILGIGNGGLVGGTTFAVPADGYAIVNGIVVKGENSYVKIGNIRIYAGSDLFGEDLVVPGGTSIDVISTGTEADRIALISFTVRQNGSAPVAAASSGMGERRIFGTGANGTIGQTAFTIPDDAFAILDGYVLKGIQSYLQIGTVRIYPEAQTYGKQLVIPGDTFIRTVSEGADSERIALAALSIRDAASAGEATTLPPANEADQFEFLGRSASGIAGSTSFTIPAGYNAITNGIFINGAGSYVQIGPVRIYPESTFFGEVLVIPGQTPVQTVSPGSNLQRVALIAFAIHDASPTEALVTTSALQASESGSGLLKVILQSSENLNLWTDEFETSVDVSEGDAFYRIRIEPATP